MQALHRYAIVPACLFLLFVAGCSSKPVRHLASDVAMIKTGETTRDNVIIYMGEPDSRRMVSPTREEWTYLEEDQSTMQKLPVVGKKFDPNGYNMVRITLEGDVVASCRYGTFDRSGQDWTKTSSE